MFIEERLLSDASAIEKARADLDTEELDQRTGAIMRCAKRVSAVVSRLAQNSTDPWFASRVLAASRALETGEKMSQGQGQGQK